MGFPSVARTWVLGTVLAAMTVSGSAWAQQQPPGSVKSNHGAWSVVCDKPAGAESEQCALMQNVIAEDRPEVGLSVVVLKTADRKSRILRVLAPLGVLLSPFKQHDGGLGLIIDGNNLGRTEFIRCFTDGCYAEVELDDQLLKTLRSGAQAIFTIRVSLDQDKIGIPVDLKGFADGYDALP